MPPPPVEFRRVYPVELTKKRKIDPLLDKFIEHFETCPICKCSNHLNYLEEFYFTADPKKVIMKQQLLNLLVNLDEEDEKLTLGIPCCNCYKEIFEEPVDPNNLRNAIMYELRSLFQRRRIE